MQHRASIAWLSIVVVFGAIGMGCADPGSPGLGTRDTGRMDGSQGDANVTPDANRDAGPPDANSDAGRGDAGTCEACSADRDCLPGAYCAALGSGIAGHGCLPSCIVDLPVCPPRFTCVAGFVSTIPNP